MDTHDARLSKLRQQMLSAGLDLLVIYSDGRHTFLECEPVLYASGFKPMGPHAAIIVPKDDAPALIVTPSWDRARAARRSRVQDVIGTDDFAAEFGRVIRERRLGESKVGVIGHEKLTRHWRNFLWEQFASPPVPFDSGLNEVAKVRDELEISLEAQAAEISDRGFEHMLEVARPGMRVYELAAEVDRYMKSLGADDNFQLILASQHNSAVGPPGDRRLDVGDVILGEISPSVSGQFVQICRTAVLGPASDLQREKHQILVEAMIAAMKAGVTGAGVADVVRALNAVVAKAGYEKYCYPPYMRVRGHGFGLGSMMPGEISLESSVQLESGMSFVLHPNQYIPETGYFLVGEPVVVTDTGLQMLTHYPLGLAEIPV